MAAKGIREMQKSKRITPRLTPEFQMQIQIAAHNMGINSSELARRAIAEYIAQLKTPRIAA
jgi:hypothetical protein